MTPIRNSGIASSSITHPDRVPDSKGDRQKRNCDFLSLEIQSACRRRTAASIVSDTTVCSARHYGLIARRNPWGVAYEPARYCRLHADSAPAAGRHLVARTGEACASADDLLLRRLQPDPMDQTPDPGGARR